ncbi:MotA/TolQ/ExbB proton channel family protein [Phenylobacterium terrae]|uniref:MotA/TolQ/ExbB proton channel family protein n=1 Tax=Phenylobacterium terrae TaxID=2665495 RepID=A0ABW4N0C2_9CAUL
MTPFRLALASAAALLAASPAAAQQAVQNPLTLGGVFADAAIEVQLVMAGLIAATLAAIVVWALELARIRKGRLENTPARQAFLKAVAGAAPLFGLAAGAYTLLMSSLALANLRPTPPLAMIAPGFAEVLLSVFLGLFASAVATTLRRHLEGRVDMWRGAGTALAAAE